MRFEFGAYGPLQIRTERIEMNLPAPLRLLYASDLHLGHRWTKTVPAQLIAAATETRPDRILLGGDLVDRTKALPELGDLVAALIRVASVGAIPGNHDVHLGAESVRSAVCEAGGTWLPDQPVDGPVRIDGSILESARRPRILCAHDPADFPAAVAAGYDIVFAGHLHGGQCVLANRHAKQYPAVWFHRWHGLRFASGSSRMLVSRGAADTFPLRVNCPREVILCELF